MKVGCRIAAAVLAVVLMLCPLCVCFAADDSQIDPGIQTIQNLSREVIMYYVWYYLQSVGIDVEYNQLDQFVGEINDWIEGELLEWLDTVPSINSIDALVAPWKFFWNPSGYLIGNHSFLDDMQKFTDWLIQKFNLQDNSSQQVESSGYTLGEYVFYSYPLVLRYQDTSDGYVISVYTSTDEVYYTWCDGGVPNCLSNHTISKDHFTLARDSYWGNSHSTQYINDSFSRGDWYVNSGTDYPVDIYGISGVPYYTSQELASAELNMSDMVPYGNNMYILTGTINPPTVSDADGTNSIIIVPSGNLYEPYDWRGVVSVDNLPAIVSTGTIRDPGINQVWLPVRAFINFFRDGFGLMTQLIYRMPDEIVSMAFAIMGVMIIFGTIKLMREH